MSIEEWRVRNIEHQLTELQHQVEALRSVAAHVPVVAGEQARSAIQDRVHALLWTDDERREVPDDLDEARPLAIAVRDNTATPAGTRRLIWLLARALFRLHRGLFRQ